MENNKTYFDKIIRILEKEYPEPKTALHFKTSHQLLVATILSAQCTDERVNIVTKELFRKYKTVQDFANADLKEFESDIHSTGFYKNKAKNIIAASKMIVDKFGGKVSDNMDDLVKLPGVARKTANVVLFEGFNKNEGIAVDTHVKRLSNLLGITESDNPEKIEKDLMDNVIHDKWGKFSNMLILHGRNVCVARKPKCEICKLNKICPSAFDVQKK